MIYRTLIVVLLFLIAPMAMVGDGQSDAAPAKVEGAPVTFPDGLKYWDIVVGKGTAASKGKRVRVHYTGWLLDGKKFDSSLDYPHPIVFTVGIGQVIRGWDEGIVGMREGGKRQLHIPADLAYGEHGSPPSVPPNADLIFDVQLINAER